MLDFERNRKAGTLGSDRVIGGTGQVGCCGASFGDNRWRSWPGSFGFRKIRNRFSRRIASIGEAFGLRATPAVRRGRKAAGLGFCFQDGRVASRSDGEITDRVVGFACSESNRCPDKLGRSKRRWHDAVKRRFFARRIFLERVSERQVGLSEAQPNGWSMLG